MGAAHLSPYIQAKSQNFGMNRLSLVFENSSFEKRYSIDYANRSLFVARIAMLFGGIQYLLFILLDLLLGDLLTSREFYGLMFIRVLVFLVILGIIGWSYRKNFIRYMQAAISIVPLLAGVGVAVMILIIQSEEGYNQYYVGLIIIFIYIHVLLRLRFIYATAVSWLLFFLFIYASLQIELPAASFINSTFFLVSAQICGMVASYLLEYYDRTVFRQKITLDNRRRELKEQYDRKTREFKEMRAIQQTLLPEQPPHHPAFDIAVTMKTASEVGGDYYDFHLSGNDTLTFVIADATGHGAKAGLMVTAAKILFLLFGTRKNLPEILTRFTGIIKSTGMKQLYLSMALGRLHENRLELSGAGMPAALIFRAESKRIEKIQLKGMPVGSITTYPYQTTTTSLEKGDLLVLISDGLPELRNKNNKIHGYDEPEKLFIKYIDLTPDEIIRKMEEEIEDYTGDAPLADDLTLIVIRKN